MLFRSTSYIVGNVKLSQIIKETSIKDLQVILTGPRTPNASELILDPMMETLINELKQHYEYIIIDTPPYLGFEAINAIYTADNLMIVTDFWLCSLINSKNYLFLEYERPNRDIDIV